MKAVFVLLVGLILASAVVGGPIFGSRQAVDEIEECSELVRFNEGFQYAFTYEAVTETGITGAGPGSTMTMTCDIVIEAQESCKNVLKTTSCRLDESPEFALEMSAYDLVFRTNKGRIIEVLAHPDEPTHILNAKRGILSMLQLDMEADDVEQMTIDEVSVHGNCSSEMTVTRRDDKQRPRKIEMVTDLNTCLLRERPETMTMWQTAKDVLFNTTIVDKFINSSKTCSYDVKGTSGEFKAVECVEVHSFWPMNFNSESGVRTSIQQSLLNTDVLRLNSFKVDPANTRSTTLRYEHDPKEVGMKPSDVTVDQAIDILKKLVKGTRDEVQMDSPRLFGRWRAALEGMDNTTIHEVFDRAYDCSQYSQSCRNNPDKAKLAREYLLDGLLPCTTMPCFSVKNYAIAKGIVPRPLANAWMVTMAFRRYPSLDVMSEMLRMAQAVPSQITIFPLSIMVHNYWINNQDLHTANALPEPMTNTIRYLKSLIGSDCSVPVENERLAMIALKAIGNIGEPVERHDQLTFSYSEKVSPSLISCAKNKQIPRDISKAAVQSMRRFVLNDVLRRQVIDELFKDSSLDVPQRIAAYLIAMKANPSVSELTGIWTFLKTEPVNQMKAFCYSHIKNVLESSEPTLQVLQKNLKKAMVDDELPEYPQDIRKYSRFFEISKNLTEPWRNNTVAAQFESDVIFTPESYLPQEVMFHYVLNALGKSWDMFETGIEMKGFEPILESVFGPEGFFPEISLQTLFENIDENILTKVREFAEAQLENWVLPTAAPENANTVLQKDKYAKKTKRQAIDPQEIINLIHEHSMTKLNELHKLVGMETSATDATIFLRLLGNEFGFVSASDALSMIPYTMGIFEEFISKTKQIPQLLSEGLDFNTTRSLVFMDKSFILATGLGMPLNCSINGTAVVSMRVRSRFSINLPKIIAAGHIAPSGAVEVLATMGIGMPTKVFTGVMANSTIYHSSKVAGNITIDGTRLKINLNNTDRPMNLFNYSTTYNLLKANGDVEFIPGVLQDAIRSQRCTDVSKVFGVDVCVSWAYPNASYVPEAPRFPFTGPNSFNVTLVNTDKALKAYTIDVEYKQLKEGGAPKPISFGSIKKSKASRKPFTKLIDTFRFSFYAPGEQLSRNITSFLSVDRLQKTAKWTFTVPEVKNFIMFAGIINETTDSSAAYRAVFNVSAADHAASVDFLVKNETTLSQKNLTAVFNASINSLYWATVGQFVRQSASGDWNAHITETYYWDNETPLYKQILFPWTGYQINHEKYQTSTMSATRTTAGPTVLRDLKMATLGWAFDVNTRQTLTDDLKELTLSTQISNATWAFPIVAFSLRNETTETGYRMEATASRNTHHAFINYDVTKAPRETNRNFRTGIRTDVFVANPDVAMFMNSPMLLRLFGETALIDEPVVIDGGVNFRILDQSMETVEHLIQTTFLVPNPRNPTSHLTYDFDLRLENATMLNKKEYSLELTTPIPLLKLSNINLLHLMVDTEMGNATMEHVLTLFDTRYNKAQATMSNSFNAGWKKPSANWFMNVETPSLNYFQNYTGIYTRENGIQLFYEYSQDSFTTDLLDFTEITNMAIKPSAVSVYWSYIHKLMNYNASNSVTLGGPITEMCPRLVPMIVRDIVNKTMEKQFSAVGDIILNKFIYNITGSSITLSQNANFTSPLIANMTASHRVFLSSTLFDHKLSFSAEHQRLNISTTLNHSLVMENRDLTLKTEGDLLMSRGLQMFTLTSVNATLLRQTTPFQLASLHYTKISSPIFRFSTMSSANGNVDETKKLNMVADHNTALTSRLGSLDVTGNYSISDMKSPTYFDDMSGILTYKLSSKLVKSSFNSSLAFNTFRKLFKFQKVQAKASHDIKSKFVTWTAQGQSLLQHFSSATVFGEASSSLEANLLSKLMSTRHSSGIILKNMNGLVQFDELSGHVSNNLTSKFVNSTYQNEFSFNNVESLVSFRKLGGSSNYVLSSRLMNVTANNTLQLNGFRSLFNFDSITGNQIWFVKTCPFNATMENDMSLSGFRKLFNFDEVTGRMTANFTSPWAKGKTASSLLIENVASFSSIATVAVESTSEFTSRPFNSSFNNTAALRNHRSFLDFDAITSATNFSSKLFNVSTSATHVFSFNGVRSFVEFDSISHSLNMAARSFYVNTTLGETITLQNFRHFNDFDLASVEVISSFVTKPLKVSYQQTHEVQGMNGWFQYPLAQTVVMANLTSCKLNVSSSYVARIENMQAPFVYDNGITKLEYSVNNRMLNITGFHGIEANNMRRILEFDRINATLFHEVDTPVSHFTFSSLLDMKNFNRLFTFDLVNVTTTNIFAITPLRTTYASYNAGLSLNDFESITQFRSVQGFSRSALLTKWTNWTMNMESDLSGFRSFMNFDRISFAGQNEFYSPALVMISNTTNDVTGSTGLFKASSAQTSSMFSFSSRFVKAESGASWIVQGLAGPLRFTSNNVDTYMNFSSPIVKTGSAFSIDMNEWQNLTHYEKLEVVSENNILTRIASWKAQSHFRLDNMAGILTYSHAEASASSDFSSIITSMNTSIDAHINGQAGLLNFDDMAVSTRANLSSRPFTAQGATDFSIANMAGFLNFDDMVVTTRANFSSWPFTVQGATDFNIARMAGFLNFDDMAVSTRANLVSRPFTAQGATDFSIANMAGFLNFDDMVITTRANFSSRPFTAQGATDFSIAHMAGFMVYDSIYGSASSNMTSRLLNTTTTTSLRANTGTGLFKVQLANVSGAFSAETPFTKEVRASSSAQITNSRKLFNFDEATMKSDISFLTKKINITGTAKSELTNFVNLTQFESSVSSVDFSVASRLFNSTSAGIMELRGFQRLFKFNKVKVGGYAVMKSILANLTTEAGIDFSNFQRIFTFERINSSSVFSLTSRLGSTGFRSGMEMNNFNGVTTFTRFNGSFISNFNTTFVNVTTGAGYSLEGFRSLFNFNKVEATAETILNNRFVNGTAMAEYRLLDSSRFSRFSKLILRSAGSFNSRFANANALASMEITNARNLTSFDQFNITSSARFTSKPVTAVAEALYSIRNQHYLYTFDEVTSRVYGTVRSKLLNATTMLESQMNNSRSLFGFDAAKTQAIFVMDTPLSAAHLQGNIHLIGFTNFTHYLETSALVSANLSSPFVSATAFSRFNISNMAGIMTFDKFLTSSFANVRSRFVNTTFQNSVSIKGVRGIKYSAIGHRFNFIWNDPINELVVKNGLDMTRLKDMSQLFNITWVNPKGSIVFNQRLNYENLITTIKVPSIGLLSAGANLNTFGDVLTFYIEHQLVKDNFKTVKDITWLLKLNESNVIYSNFSWNPETVAEIVDVTVGAINSTFNRTVTIANTTIARIMEVANRTLTHTRRMTNCTKCFMRYTLMLANDTMRVALKELNQTLYDQAISFNQTVYTLLKKYNATFYTQLDRLNKTVIFARNHPREFLSQYINITRLNETAQRLNVTLREMYAKLRHNITHPKETLENIKLIVKYEERLDQIKWLIGNRDVIKSRISDYLLELKANITTKAKEAITDLKERIQFEEKLDLLTNYIETRFNIPKFQEKIQELKLKIEEVKVKMADLKVKAGEKINDLKLRIASLDREAVKAEIMARIEQIKEFIMHYLNSTTIDAIERSIFIDYKDDAQVQDLMRKIIRIRPRNLVDIVDKNSVMEVKDMVLSTKDKMIEGLEFLNQTTFRYVNKTFLNETAKQTIEMLRLWNATFNDFVRVDLIKGDIKIAFNFTRGKVFNMTKAVKDFLKAKAQVIKAFLTEKWDARPKSLEELKARLMEVKEIVKDYIQERYNIDIDMVAENIMNQYENIMNQYLQRREQMDMIIAKIIAISKNETHPVNMLPLCYFNRTIYQIVQPPVNMTMNLTVLYGKMAANFTKVYSIEALNFTKVYSRIAMEKGMAMTKKYVPIIKKALKDYRSLAVKQSKLMKEKAILYFNMTKGNVTLYYQKYAPIVNQTIRNYTIIGKEVLLNYSIMAKEVLFNYTVIVRNITDQYINMTIEYLEPHVQPYREMLMQRVERMKMRAAELKERIRQLPAQTEQYLMDKAEYHIDKYPEYKQKVIQKVEELKMKVEELKVKMVELRANLTKLYSELKVNMTRLYGELKQNATEAYVRYSNRMRELYAVSQEKFNDYKMRAQNKWQEIRPIIMTKSGKFLNTTKLRINQTLETALFTIKDEYSLINELPMRALDKTIFELTMELKEYIQQLVENAKVAIRSRDSLINKYPVMYLNMTVIEAGNFTYAKVLFASNLTKFYANKTIQWANSSLVSANKTMFDILILTNQTMRDVVIPFINQTAGDVIAFVNRTRFQPWNATLNETICFLNRTSVVLRNKANETYLVFQAKAMEAWKNLTSEESIARMKAYLNMTKTRIISGLRVANETIFMLRNKSVTFILYIRDETPLLNLTKEYALMAKNLTQASINQARNMTQQTIYLARNMSTSIVTYIQGPAKDYTMGYVTYVNNTMAGWAFRYYEVDQIPVKVSKRLAALKPVEMAKNLTKYAITRARFMTQLALNRSEVMTRYAMNQTRMMTSFALNQTRILTKQAINRTRTLIRDTLNTIGRLDDHSFAINISHPFNWTSFRTLPTLSNNQIKFIKDKVIQLNQTVVIPIMNKIQELRHNLTERYNNISMMIMEFYDEKKPIVEEKINELRAKIQEKIEEYKQLLNEYKQLLQTKWETEWKPELEKRKQEVIDKWENEIKPKWENEIKPKIDEVVADLKAFIKSPNRTAILKAKALELKNVHLPELKRVILEEKYPELRRFIVEEKYPEIKRQVLDKYEEAKAIFEEFKENVTLFRQEMETKIQKMMTQAEDKWSELQERIQQLRENWPETFEKIKADIEDVKIQLKAKLTEFINKVLTALRELRIPVEILPLEHINLYNPWKYTAMIFGDSHVMTFDGKVYSVPPYVNERQTYVLAHDFIDRNFTLLTQQNVITLLVNDVSVSIDEQNVVRLNGVPQLQELPYQTPISKELTIFRKGPWVNVTSTKGIALSCHVDHFMCIVHLSGWYHGKSRGLLGNLDTEHHNEFVLPDGDITTDLLTFISAYDVSPFDMPRMVIPSRFGVCASDYEKCVAMFSSEDSILNDTFSIINQTEFFNFCVEETRKCSPSCEATNPVVALGRDLGADVSYDPECLDCVVGDEAEENKRPTNSVDIVFIVSETAAMAEDNNLLSSLKTIIKRIKNKLNAYNVTGVNYGITAYGGEDIHAKPHHHTLCGHLMDSNIDCAYSGVDSLVFQGPRPIDAMHAVQLAANYPFRKNAAKIVVLIADEDFTEDSRQPWDFLFNINTTLKAMQRLLSDKGITFNVFSSYSTLNKKTPESPILGVNYLGKQIINKKSSGEAGIDRLDIPDGQYAKLAKATRGSIMGLKWLQTGHPDMTYMMPKLIWKQIQPQASGQVDYHCQCVIGMYGEARTDCQISRFFDGFF